MDLEYLRRLNLSRDAAHLFKYALRHEPMTDEEFEQALGEQPWTEAASYRGSGLEHEYFVRTDNYDLFWELKRRIARYGYERDFNGTPHFYYHYGGYKYWGYDLVMNRERTDEEPPEDDGPTQQRLIEEANVDGDFDDLPAWVYRPTDKS